MGRIKTSTAGNWSRSVKTPGFTLIELIVVISLLSLLLLFSFPMLSNVSFFKNTTGDSNDLIRLVNDLKKRAVQNNTDYILHFDITAQTLWVTSEGMDDEQKEGAREEGVPMAENFSILGVELKDDSSDAYDNPSIRFRKQGYSDFALVHLTREQTDITLKVEPFLSQAQWIEQRIHFSDCI